MLRKLKSVLGSGLVIQALKFFVTDVPGPVVDTITVVVPVIIGWFIKENPKNIEKLRF